MDNGIYMEYTDIMLCIKKNHLFSSRFNNGGNITEQENIFVKLFEIDLL